jgi:glycosyltransferase involved in cell wall biosynthesis
VQNPEDAGTRIVSAGVTVFHTNRTRLPGPAAVLEQAWLLLSAAQSVQPDVLHLFKPKGYGGLAVLAAQLVQPDLPLVLDSDDWEGWGGWNDLLPYPIWAKWLFAWQERDLPRRAAAMTVVSRTLEQQALGFGVAPDRIFYLPNGTERIPPTKNSQRVGDSEHPTLLLYTRFWEFEVAFLVALLTAIAHVRPDVRVLVIGRGERGEQDEFLRGMQQAGQIGMVDYRGWVEPEQIPGLVAQADIAIAPMDNTLINRARGLAKLLELMAAGLPIVASRVGQATEYLEHGHSGILVAPGDPDAFARATIALLNDPAMQAQLAANVRQRAAQFEWDRLAMVAEAAYWRAGQI